MSMLRGVAAWRWLAAGWLALCLLALGAARPAQAAERLAVPALTGRVMDQTGSLSAPQAAALDAKLAAFEARSGPQIVVLLVPSTQPEDIAAYAYRVADQWKIGRREVGDGLLLLVAKDDRRVRIEVARALEGAVPDLAARQIIDQAIAPAFRQSDYAGGLNQAVDRLIARIQGEGVPAPAAQPRAQAHSAPELPGWVWVLLVAAPLVATATRAWLGPVKGALVVGSVAGGVGGLTLGWTLGLLVGGAAALVTLIGIGNLLTQLVLNGRGGGGGSWGGGGGGGGGFSSGGGGSFGGGGASGNW